MGKETTTQGEIILYHPNESIRLEVKLEDETVWLTQQQMVTLFGSSKGNISEHITNIYQQEELPKESTVRIFRTVRKEGSRFVTRELEYYNLDMIISVGFRVNSKQGIHFRRWANQILKEYILHGHVVQQQIMQLEERFDRKLIQQHDEIEGIKAVQSQQQQQLNFFIRTNTPPAEMVFFDGDFFTARVAIERIIQTAQKRVIIIDAYVDAKTFDMMDVCSLTVTAQIYTAHIGAGMIRLRDDHNRQASVPHIEISSWEKPSHDRWLIVDDTLYHCGHSLNATGNKISAITKMGCAPEVILKEIC